MEIYELTTDTDYVMQTNGKLKQFCFIILAIFIFCALLNGCSKFKLFSHKTTNKKSSITTAQLPLYQQPEVKEFMTSMVTQYDFKYAKLEKLFKQAKIKQEILNKIEHPYEAVPWYEYQQHFLMQRRINNGVKFWHKYAMTLRRAYKKYGVPPSIIVAIIGVESAYGKQMGKFKVINALSTLGFKYPKRAEYFQKELAQFLLLCREKHINPLKIYGSYAGAIGQPQFMPSNFRQYAVDFNNPNSADLIHNPKDAIASVANFFQAHGWQHGKSIALKAKLNKTFHGKMPDVMQKPQFTLAQLTKYHLKPMAVLPSHALVNIVKLQGKKGPLYWLGFHNIYVITSYNTNIQYAMAVYQLSREIRKNYLHSLRHKPPLKHNHYAVKHKHHALKHKHGSKKA